MTVGEMIAFPFANAFAMERAKRGNQGEYMALYVMSFSLASIFGFNIGLQMVAGIGFDHTWTIMALLSMLCVLMLYVLKFYLRRNGQVGS